VITQNQQSLLAPAAIRHHAEHARALQRIEGPEFEASENQLEMELI
jgi:hypothetical protein